MYSIVQFLDKMQNYFEFQNNERSEDKLNTFELPIMIQECLPKFFHQNEQLYWIVLNSCPIMFEQPMLEHDLYLIIQFLDNRSNDFGQQKQ